VPIEPRASKPGFIKPCLATLQTDVPTGAGWLHEIKFDGYRMQPHIDGESVAVYSRNGLDWTKRFRFLARALLDLPAKQLILDCELVSAASKSGAADFSQL
jgi:bifunctional non-homologous end joining protein LigD